MLHVAAHLSNMQSATGSSRLKIKSQDIALNDLFEIFIFSHFV